MILDALEAGALFHAFERWPEPAGRTWRLIVGTVVRTLRLGRDQLHHLGVAFSVPARSGHAGQRRAPGHFLADT